MTIVNFIEKNKKVILVVLIVFGAILLGFLTTEWLGGLGGLTALFWTIFSGKRDKTAGEHQDKQGVLDEDLAVVKAEEKKLLEELAGYEVEEDVIREEILKLEKKFDKMSLEEKIKQHNESLGF